MEAGVGWAEGRQVSVTETALGKLKGMPNSDYVCAGFQALALLPPPPPPTLMTLQLPPPARTHPRQWLMHVHNNMCVQILLG